MKNKVVRSICKLCGYSDITAKFFLVCPHCSRKFKSVEEALKVKRLLHWH